MKPTDILKEEHKVIIKALKIMEENKNIHRDQMKKHKFKISIKS